jgi:hypothetical protein
MQGDIFDDVILGTSIFLGNSKFAMQRLKLTGNCKRTRIKVTNTEAGKISLLDSPTSSR